MSTIEVPSRPSPRVNKLAWGRLEVEGLGAFQDAKLHPGGGRAWDWRETWTHHVPGIQPADVAELLERGAMEVILSQGFWDRLQIAPKTLQWLQDKGIPVQVLQMERAVALYNERREAALIGGLIHSTC